MGQRAHTGVIFISLLIRLAFVIFTYLSFQWHGTLQWRSWIPLSKAAFDVLADAVFTDACPLTDLKPSELHNDNILSACAFRNSILKVTSSIFSTYNGAKQLDLRAESSWLDQITVHKVQHESLAEKKFCWSEHYHGRRPPQVCNSHITYV